MDKEESGEGGIKILGRDFFAKEFAERRASLRSKVNLVLPGVAGETGVDMTLSREEDKVRPFV